MRTYLNDGELCGLLASGLPVGIVLLTVAGPAAIEIRNIAIRREHRRQGVGRAQGAVRLMVGTANASAGTVAFYRGCGFHDAGRIEGFCERYPEPVIEHGVRARDMARFEMLL